MWNRTQKEIGEKEGEQKLSRGRGQRFYKKDHSPQKRGEDRCWEGRKRKERKKGEEH